MALARHGELSQAELGRNIGMEPANVHSLVDRLLALRYIKLGACPADQRQVRVRLTVLGEKRATEISMLAACSSQETLAPLDAAERVTLLSLLVRIALE
jgi:DNA-binding MarR family transcriptional regulator